MQFKECLSEACRKCRCRLCDSTLCASKFSCESRQEVVLSLLWCQDRYWRKYSECICGKEDNILCSRCRRDRANDLLNVVDRIRYTGILCNALICEINLSFCIKCNVLKKSVSLDCIVDIWLGIFIKVDNFRIAAALEVSIVQKF